MNRTQSSVSIALLLAAAGTALASVPPSYQSPIVYSTPTRPAGIAVADFNGDGLNDLALTTDTPDKIIIMYNNAAAEFPTTVNVAIPLGSGAESIVAGDFNGDGRVDFAAVMKNLNLMRVYYNAGGGAFTAGPSATVGSNARTLQAVDMTGTGRLDFATANRDANTVSLIKWNAGALVVSSVATGSNPRSVSFGDFNGDGKADMVVANHGSRTLGVYMNDGAGNFGAPTSYNTLGERPDGAAAGDVNGDGRADIVYTAGNFVAVMINNGTGGFGTPVLYSSGGQAPSHPVLSDLNVDGSLDIAVANEDSGTIAVLTNQGTGAFGQLQLLTAGTFPDGLFAGRLNGDNIPEIVVTNRDSNNTMVFSNSLARPQCTPADISAIGGLVGADGSVSPDDLIIFLHEFFEPHHHSFDDMAHVGGGHGQDDNLTADDVIAFLQSFFGGCN